MALFNINKKKKAVINYVDLDNDLANIGTSGEISGEIGQKIDYSSQDKIKELESKGYVLESNGFDPNGEAPRFEEDNNHVYVISFKHGEVTISAPNATYHVSAKDLEKVGTQTVHYEGAANRTPRDSESQVHFKQSLLFDKITKRKIRSLGWQPETHIYRMISTPEIPGFIADRTYVGGETVAPEDCDRNYTVNYSINNEPSTNNQKVVIKYVDIDRNNKEITNDTLIGKPNMPVDYDPKMTIAKLEREKGYALVDNGYNPDGEVQFYGNNDKYIPVFIITMKHTIGPVDIDHPSEKVPRVEFEKDVSFAVDFEGAGAVTPVNKVQNARWVRTITVDKVTGKIIPDGKYTSTWTTDSSGYDDVVVPVVPGYHTKEKVVHGGSKISQENVTKTIKYIPNGKLIPVDENGKEIKGVKQPIYKTDASDPTKIVADEIVPDIKGYTHDKMTFTPRDPAEDTKISYKAVKKDDVLVIPVGQKHGGESKKSANTSSKVTPISKTASKPKAEAQPQAKPANKPKPRPVPQSQSAPVAEKPKKQAHAQKPEKKQAQPEAQKQVVPAQTQHQTPENKPEAKVPARQADTSHDQVAIINFIDLDQNGKQLTSSGPLTGKPGESINDLYSTEIPLKAISQAGYEVVFNNFDGDGIVQRFDNNDLMTQVFTIGLRKKRKHPAEKPAPTAEAKPIQATTSAAKEAHPLAVPNKDLAPQLKEAEEKRKAAEKEVQELRRRFAEQKEEEAASRRNNNSGSSVAAMALGLAATVISLIGWAGNRRR